MFLFILSGWVMFGLLAWWHVYSKKKSSEKSGKKLIHLDYFIVWLLLNDEMRNKWKNDFDAFLRDDDATSAPLTGVRAFLAIDSLGEQLAQGEDWVLGTSALLWTRKNELKGK
jgi:hypothetical protein